VNRAAPWTNSASIRSNCGSKLLVTACEFLASVVRCRRAERVKEFFRSGPGGHITHSG
jgi:hypothetical protein